MNGAEIATALGAATRSGQWWRCVCPVHGSRTGHSATLALRDGARSLIVHCHAGCDARGTTQSAIDCRDHERRIENARRIWAAGIPAGGTPVTQYLAGRGIVIDPPPVLRWTPRCWHREECAELPAMLARVDRPDGGLVGVHRTYLLRDGRGRWHRRDRASLGPISGGAVRLGQAAETLITGEGIETVLAVMLATGLPGWAALSTSGLSGLILPPLVHAVIIVADHDHSGAGERAAFAAAARWIREGRQVRIAMPPEPDTDFADVLAGRTAAGLGDVAA